jgi:hypothetical protein
MKTHLLKTETNGVANYEIVSENAQLPKDTKYFIPYRPCIYKGVECAIITEHLNYYWIVFEGSEIKVTSNEIELI